MQLPLMCMVLSSMFFSAGRIVVAGVQVIPLPPPPSLLPLRPQTVLCITPFRALA